MHLEIIILKEESQIVKDKYQINIVSLICENLKNIYKWTYLKQQKQTDVENKVTVTKRGGGGRDKIGDSG